MNKEQRMKMVLMRKTTWVFYLSRGYIECLCKMNKIIAFLLQGKIPTGVRHSQTIMIQFAFRILILCIF